MCNFRRLSNNPYDFLKFKFYISLPKLGYFLEKKGNLKFSDSKMLWREVSENVSLSYYVQLHQNFRKNTTQALIISKRLKFP